MPYDFRWISWNISKVEGHGLAVSDVEHVVNGACRPYPKPIGNEKWLVIGPTPSGRVIQVIYLVDVRRETVRDPRPPAHPERTPTPQETIMKRKKPLAPSLPARFGRMTREELDAEADQYNDEFSAVRAKRVENARPHPKKRGRPRKPVGSKAARVLITMTPQLLAAADAAAERKGLTRAGLVREAVLDWLARQTRSRKSA